MKVGTSMNQSDRSVSPGECRVEPHDVNLRGQEKQDTCNRAVLQFRALASLASSLSSNKHSISYLVETFVLPFLNAQYAIFTQIQSETHFATVRAEYRSTQLSINLLEHVTTNLHCIIRAECKKLNDQQCGLAEKHSDLTCAGSTQGSIGQSDDGPYLFAAISYRDKVVGAIACWGRCNHAFNDDDATFLTTCATLISDVLSMHRSLSEDWSCESLAKIAECSATTDLIRETALGMSVDLICAVDNDLVVTYFNQAFDDCFYRHHGIHLKTGSRLDEKLSNSPDRARLVSMWRNVIDSGIASHERNSNLFDGKEEIFATSVVPLSAKNGELCGAVMLVRDITEHILVARQVKRSQELLQKSQQVARIGSWEMDFSTGALSWSDEMYELLEVSKLLTVPSFEMILERCHPDDRLVFEQCTALARLDGKPYSVDWRMMSKDGSRWYCSMGAPVFNENGQLLRMEGVLIDINSRKRAELHADKVHKQFIQFMDNPNILAWITTVDTEIRYINEPYAKMFGLTVNELVGKTGYDMFPEHQLKAIIEHNKMVAATGTSHEMEETLTKPDGTLGTYLVQKFPISSETDEPLVGGIAIDVTSQRLLQAELLQSQKMDGIGRLAGGIAHDFNNLLSVILGYAELVQESLDPVEVQASVAQIQKAAQRAATLTSQLLSFARKQIVSPSLVVVAKVIEDAYSMLKPLIGDNITFTADIVPHNGRVLIDFNQFEQVIVNLVVNARDAIKNHGVIKISARPDYYEEPLRRATFEIAAGDYARIEVSDSGMGMNTDTLAHAFEPFYTTKPSGKGTGLGLATVYGIIKQNRGYVWLDSVAGLGTTATILLPLTYSDDGMMSTVSPTTNKVAGEVIMVVEDEHVLRVLTVNALTVRGYTVIEAANGREALNYLSDESTKVDLIITDSNMPLMGGIELARNLRVVRPHLPVIVATGYSHEITNVANEVPGDITFMFKPYTMAKLANKVAELLGKSQQAGR